MAPLSLKMSIRGGAIKTVFKENDEKIRDKRGKIKTKRESGIYIRLD
jgi:hypothetical protein